MPICDNCGMGLPVGYEYCFKCGYPVRGLPAGDADPAGAAAQQPDRKSTRLNSSH